MRNPLIVVAAALTACTVLPAHAFKLFTQVSPANLKSEGFALKSSRERGMVKIELTRDLGKSKWQSHAGYLQMPGRLSETRARSVSPRKKGTLERYRFSVPAARIAHARFEISEYETDPNSNAKEALIGGGTIYTFDLKDFFPAPQR